MQKWRQKTQEWEENQVWQKDWLIKKADINVERVPCSTLKFSIWSLANSIKLLVKTPPRDKSALFLLSEIRTLLFCWSVKVHGGLVEDDSIKWTEGALWQRYFKQLALNIFIKTFKPQLPGIYPDMKIWWLLDIHCIQQTQFVGKLSNWHSNRKQVLKTMNLTRR